MSNPFATFRKNQTYWMAALVLIAILAFIIAPAIDMVTKSFRGGGGNNQVIAKWDGGRITQAEVDETLSKRVALRNFLSSLAKKVIEAGGTPAVPGFMQFNGQIFSLGVNDNLSAETVAMTKIMLTQAQKMGVEFNDLAADEFLKEFCNEKITDAEFNELLKTNNLTIFEVRELIKQDLTTTTAEELAMGGRRTASPGRLWQNFLKLNQTAKVEAYPISTSSYMDKVTGKPTEAQLQELYEAGKNRAANPDSPEPGFVRLDQANVEFVESNYSTWFEAEKAKVTEQELRAEYERQLAVGSLKVPLDYKSPAASTPPATEPTTEPAKEPNSTPPASDNPESPTTPSNPTDSPAVTPPSPAPTQESPATPASEKPATPGDAPVAPPGDVPAAPPGDIPAAPTGDVPAAPPADNPQGSLSKSTKDLRLVSFVQEDLPTAQPPATEEPAGTPQAKEAAPATEPTTATVEAPAVATNPQSTPDATTEPPATATLATQPPTNPTTGDDPIAVAEPAKPATPPMRDMTFEEARERVLRMVADERASKLSGDALAKLQKVMREFYLANRQYQTLRNADVSTRQVKQPVRPDLKKFAEENGLQHGETGLGDRMTLAASQFGRSVVLSGEQGMGLVAEVAPLPQLELFAPLQSQYQGQDAYYLYYFWKTDAKPAFVPQLSEIRDQVEDTWRRIESRKYAEEAAQALLKKTGSGEKPWDGALSETEQSLIIGTEKFTWLSRLGNEIQLTDVAKLNRVGDDFMKQVFNTEEGKFGIAANNAKTVYYVFRVLEKDPVADLQTRFSNDPIRQGPNQIANNEMRAATNNWRNKVIEELNVQFP